MLAVADQDLPGGSPTSKWGANYYLTIFFQKLQKNEEILAERGTCHYTLPLKEGIVSMGCVVVIGDFNVEMSKEVSFPAPQKHHQK